MTDVSHDFPTVAAFSVRERQRAMLKTTFPRRHGRLILARTAAELSRAFQQSLVDAAVVDVAQPTDETWSAVAMARDFPSVPFFALAPSRAADSASVARCAASDFADVCLEGVDEGALRALLTPRSYTARFAAALVDAGAPLGLTSPMQLKAWEVLVWRAGRLVRTEAIAETLGVTREHLSRAFSVAGAPNLKRIIDLVRLISAAELAKNPGYDSADVATVLGFASASHLSSTAQRVVGARATSLARLRTADLIDRFRQAGRGRSRQVS